MIALTRNDLVMILDKMDKNNADRIKLDMHIRDYDSVIDVDFDMYNHGEYINTVLELNGYLT